MCTGKFQFRKPGAVEQNQRTEKFGRPPPVFFRASILPYDQQGAQETSKRETAEIQGGFCFEWTCAAGEAVCLLNRLEQGDKMKMQPEPVIPCREETTARVDVLRRRPHAGR